MFFKKKNKEKIKLLLICGVSGSGKTWIEKELVNHPTDNLIFHKLNQYTTRPPRSKEEVELKVYNFINESEYNEIKDDLIAKTEVNGYHYGTLKDFLRGNKKRSVINTIIVNRRGYDDITSYLKNNKDFEILTLKITINSEIKNREDRNIEKEKEELKTIGNISIDNSFGNRATYEEIVKILKTVKFI